MVTYRTKNVACYILWQLRWCLPVSHEKSDSVCGRTCMHLRTYTSAVAWGRGEGETLSYRITSTQCASEHAYTYARETDLVLYGVEGRGRPCRIASTQCAIYTLDWRDGVKQTVLNCTYNKERYGDSMLFIIVLIRASLNYRLTLYTEVAL